ncbi:hypothetical protein [Pseudonocardia xishanensis]|uniref:Uncharacterized protein n=1 Tax=Pseudonocardia xishanensis TaxID=630995 RepID=A0ABP8RRI7_9PSEU
MSILHHDYRPRGRIVARRPGVDPDVLLSCPQCAAVVVEGDQPVHDAHHELINRTLRVLTGEA